MKRGGEQAAKRHANLGLRRSSPFDSWPADTSYAGADNDSGLWALFAI